MAGRFIKLYEQMTNWEWFNHPPTLSLFIYLLLKANYKDTKLKGKVIKRGQVLTSLPKISTDVGLSIRQARTALAHLISTGEVTDVANSQYRIITICKYDQYQTATGVSTGKRQAIDRQNDRRSTDESTSCIEYIEQIEDIEQIEEDNKKPTTSTTSSKRFVKPTLDEVRKYCWYRKNDVDWVQFYEYYEANGWHVGRNPMKDWKAAVRYWETSAAKRSED